MSDTINALYVDDEIDLLTIGKLFLERNGDIRVTIVTSAILALESMEGRLFDIIVSDYQMPGMDGISFLKHIRESGDKIPFILFTGRGREEVVIEALNNGADFYLQKGGEPMAQFAELSHKIHQAVRRRRVEQAFDDKKSQLQTLINAMPDIVCFKDAQGRWLEANTYDLELFQLTDVDYSGKTDRDLASISPFYRDAFFTSESSDKIAWEKKGISRSEEEIPRPDGSTKVFDVIKLPIFNPDGSRHGLVVVGRDVTERKRAEDALKESEKLYRSVIENIQDVYYRSDRDGNLILASRSAATLLGYDSVDEILGKPIADTFYDDPEEREVLLTNLQKTGSVSNFETRLHKKDGTVVHVSTSSHFFYDASGKVSGVEGIIRDITDRKRAEEKEKHQTKSLAILNEIITTANRSDDVHSLLHAILNATLTLMEYDAGGIYLTDHAAETATVVESRNLPPEFLEQIKTVSIREAPYEALLREGTPVITEHYEMFSPGRAQETGFLSLASVPLRSKEKIIGALNVISKQRHLVTGQEREILVSIGRELGTTIERMVSEKDLIQKNEELQAAYDVIFKTGEELRENLEKLTIQEQALRESEEKFRTFFESAGDAIIILDNGIIYDGNHQAEVLFRVSKSLLFGKSLADFAPDMQPGGISSRDLEAEKRRHMQDGNPQTFEFVFHYPDKTEFFAEVTLQQIRMQGRWFQQAIVRDISERKRAEMELLRKNEELATAYEEILSAESDSRANQQLLIQKEMDLEQMNSRLDDIISFLPDATFVINRDGIVIAWNRAMEDMTGILAGQMLGQGKYAYSLPFYHERRPILIDLALSGDPDFVDKYLSSSRTGDFLTSEIFIPHFNNGNGAYLWFTACPFSDPDGNVIGAIECIRDITERRIAELALEKHLVALTRPLEDASVSFDELFDIREIQKIQDEFAEATGVASIITYPDGTPITRPSRFTHLCSEIIRKTDRGCENCYRSDAIFGSHHPDGPVVQPCLSGGLWEAGAGIVLGNRHIANWLIGQVRDESQTEEAMRTYAREIGADEEAVAAAFRLVPSMPVEQFRSIAQYLYTLANHLSRSAYQNVQQARFIMESKRAEAQLRSSYEQIAAAEEELRHQYEELAKVQEKLEQNQEQLEAITETIPGVVYQFYARPDGEMGLYYVSSRAQDIFGISSSVDDFFERFTECVDTRDRDAFLQSNAEATGSGLPWRYEGRFIKPSGEEIWFQGMSLPVRHERELIFNGILLDITDRKAAESELMKKNEELHAAFEDISAKEEELRGNLDDMARQEKILCESRDQVIRQNLLFTTLLDNLSVGVFMVSAPGGAPLVANNAARKMLGRGILPDATSENLSEVYKAYKKGSNALYPVEEMPIIRGMYGEHAHIDDMIVERPDGTKILLEVSGTPILDEKGTIIASLVSFSDITDRKRAERELLAKNDELKASYGQLRATGDALREANKKLGLLSSVTRHDILNKISVQLGLLDLAQERAKDIPEMALFIRKLESTAKEIGAQIEFTRIYQDLGTDEPQWEDLHEILATISVPPELSVSDDGLTEIFADRMLVKVFENLIDNAIRHGGKVTQISMTAEEADGTLIIRLEDDGFGIPEDEKEKIFERGYGKNTGFGLFLVREILAITGISICETGEPGMGARFEIRVPEGKWRRQK